MTNPGTQRSILITGAASGIGLDAARGLRADGWRVFAACRQAADCARLTAEGFEAPQLDYSDPDSIATALDTVLAATGGTLDALFNNGAFAVPGAVEDLPTDALRANFEANLFGWHDLTTRVIPVMRAQGPRGRGRIVNCSSVLGMVAAPWRGSYNATKFALEGLTDTLRLEMRDTGIHVVTIAPGPITTAFRRNAALQFERWVDWEASPRAAQYRDTLRKRLYRDEGPDPFELPPGAVTAKLRRALDSPRPRARYHVTTPTYLMDAARRALPRRTLDWLLAKG
jgi:NAD(P)-dependent dehydrogenase (short-subunit alcohol dehydrogenase family)